MVGVSLALDSNDKVHISYAVFCYPPCIRDMKYLTNASGKWVLERVDRGRSPGDSSLALDSNDKVYISYRMANFEGWYYIHVANNVFGCWLTEMVGKGSANSLTLDSNDNVHIAYRYYDSSNGILELKYAQQKSDNS